MSDDAPSLDPPPGNQSGKRIETVTHEVSHHINWGYVAAGAGAAALAWVLHRLFLADDDDDGDRRTRGGATGG